MRRRKGGKEEGPEDPLVRDDPSASKEEEESTLSIKGKTETKELKKASKCSLTRVIKWVVGTVALLAVGLAVVVGLVMFFFVFVEEFLDWKGYERAQDIHLPPHVMDLFHVFDGNKDGVLDPFEFAIVAEQLRTAQKVSHTQCRKSMLPSCNCGLNGAPS